MKQIIVFCVFLISLVFGFVYAETIDGRTAYDWFKMGCYAIDSREYDNSILCFKKAISLNPEYAQAYAKMGYAYDIKGDPEKAIEFCKIAISIDPRCEEAYTIMGIPYFERMSRENTLGGYEKPDSNLSVIPVKAGIKASGMTTDEITYFNMGNTYFKKEDYDKAIELYEKVININPKRDDVYFNMANAYYKKKNFDKEIEMYQKAIIINPKFSDAYKNMGIAYYVKGNREIAISCFKRAAALGNKQAQEFLKKEKIETK